jgi:1,4-dihydroxy-2-naphthoyl-CoA hydrolase
MSSLVAAMPFAAKLGLEVDAASPEEVRGSLAYASDLCTAGGVLHGGVLMALADALGAICAYLNLPEGATTATIESKTNFFRPVREGRVEAVSSPLHVGRTVIVVQTDIRAAGKHVAQVTQTQAVIGPGHRRGGEPS